jgi:hypothetical protein
MATYTVAPGGGNINSASTYVGGVGIPGAADNIDFTISSGQLTVNTSTTITNIDFSNYQNVITFNSSLIINGNIVFGDAGGNATYTVVTNANGDFRKTGTGFITSNNKVWAGKLTFLSGTYTITLNDKATISGAVTVGGSVGTTITLSSANVLDTERFDVLGDFTYSGTLSALAGTALIKFTGTANQSVSWTSTGAVRNNIKIDKTGGTLSLSGTINYNTGTFTYVQGTVDAGTSTLNSAISTTFATNGITWNNVTFAGTSQTYTFSNDFTIAGNLSLSGTTAMTLTGNNIFITGNLSITTTASIGGTTLITFNGTVNQTWNHTAAGYLGTSVTINKTSGTLTLGANVYYATGTLTHTLGDVDVITNSNTFQTVNATINTPNITWNNFFFASSGANTMTLANNLYISNTFTCGGQGTINGAFNIYCGNCNINNSSSGATNTTITYSGIIYCSNNLTYSSNTGVSSITGTVYVGGSVFFNAPASTQGAGNIYMVGNGVISSLSIAYPINTNLYFDTGGKIIISSPINFANGASRIINLIRGNIDASKCDLYLNQSFNHTLTNMNKIAFRGVYLRNNASLTMNEFFCGKPNLKTIVASTSASNYTVTFTDNFEKIAKFVTITNCTLSRPQQLLLITDDKKSSTNTRGIRYINNLPNGISKDNPSTSTQTTYSTNMLVGDPSFVKSI